MQTGKQSRIRSIMLVLLCLAVLIALYFFLHSSLFFISKVTVNGNKVVPTKDIVSLSGIKTGTNIFDFNTEASIKAVKIIPKIKNAQLSRKLPDEVVIQVTERKPWALVPSKEGFLIIDDQGICLDKNQNLDLAELPVISLTDVPARINEGQQLNANSIKLVRQIITSLPPWLLKQVSEYHCSKDNQVSIFTIDGIQIRLGGSDRLAEKLRLLEEAMKLRDQNDSQETFDYIDLRYKGQPVIRDTRN